MPMVALPTPIDIVTGPGFSIRTDVPPTVVPCDDVICIPLTLTSALAVIDTEPEEDVNELPEPPQSLELQVD